MIKLICNKPINGDQLKKELKEVGIITEVLLYPNDDLLFTQADESDRLLLESVWENHIPEVKPEPTVEEKLASVGLSVDDLKVALGLEQSL